MKQTDEWQGLAYRNPKTNQGDQPSRDRETAEMAFERRGSPPATEKRFRTGLVALPVLDLSRI